MFARWGKAFLWSTVGGAAIGAVAVLAGSRRHSPAPAPKCQKIPRGCSRVVLWTQGYQIEDEDGVQAVHDTYVLQVTTFKAWSVLELPSEPGLAVPEGSTIYHVTHIRSRDGVGGEPCEESVLDRYYATISLIDPNGKSCVRNRIARGGVLELAECLVGGTANGVETGNVRCSAAPILNFRFEYGPAGAQLHDSPAKAS